MVDIEETLCSEGLDIGGNSKTHGLVLLLVRSFIVCHSSFVINRFFLPITKGEEREPAQGSEPSCALGARPPEGHAPGVAHDLTRALEINLTSPEVFKIPNENVVIQILSGYKAQSGTVAKSFITPSLSKSSLMSLGMFVIKLCPSLLPTCK